jgi:hypothetical protein
LLDNLAIDAPLCGWYQMGIDMDSMGKEIMGEMNW